MHVHARYPDGTRTQDKEIYRQIIAAMCARCDVIVNHPGGMAGTPEALMYLRAQLPPGSTWTVAGIGAAQLPLGALAIVLGGSNAQLVARIARQR